jgi:TolA-binding protein
MSDPLDPNDALPPLDTEAVDPPPPAWKSSAKPPFKPSPLPGILTGLALGGLLVGAGIILAQTLPKPEPAPAASTVTPAPADAKPEATAAAAPAPDPVATLTGRVDELSKKVDSLPKPEPAPDLKPIEAKFDALSKRLDAAAVPDTKAVEEKAAQAAATASAAQAKLDALAKAVESEKADLAALKDQVKSLAEAKPTPVPAETAAAAPAPAANAAADADYAKAVDLFKKNQFAPARDAFAKLQQATPNDPRVWYYGALSNGYATNVWNGETERMVLKGRELEKAGGDALKINTAFADLPAQTKSWLDAYRNR